MAGLMGGGAQFAGTQASAAAQGFGGVQGNYWANMMEQFGDREYDKADWDWLGLGGGGGGSNAALSSSAYGPAGGPTNLAYKA